MKAKGKRTFETMFSHLPFRPRRSLFLCLFKPSFLLAPFLDQADEGENGQEREGKDKWCDRHEDGVAMMKSAGSHTQAYRKRERDMCDPCVLAALEAGVSLTGRNPDCENPDRIRDRPADTRSPGGWRTALG